MLLAQLWPDFIQVLSSQAKVEPSLLDTGFVGCYFFDVIAEKTEQIADFAVVADVDWLWQIEWF